MKTVPTLALSFPHRRVPRVQEVPELEENAEEKLKDLEKKKHISLENFPDHCGVGGGGEVSVNNEYITNLQRAWGLGFHQVGIYFLM